MDSLGSQSWSQAEQQLDPMAQMTNDLDNLGDFLDFGEIDLDIPDLDTTQYGDHVQQPQQVSHSDTPFNDLNQAQTPQGISALDFGGAGQFELSQNLEQHQSQYNRHVQASHPLTTGPGYQPAMQQNLQYPTQQFQYHPQAGFLPHHHVPPTPNSLEMHGEAGHFMHQHQLHQIDPKQQALLEQHYRARKDDTMAFTPMVSPTGTPLYNMQPEFTAPGAYFSPLTSPMLHGQNGHNASQSQHLQGYYTNPSTAPSSNATSPIDLSGDVSMMGDGLQLPESAAALPRRSRRKAVTPRNVAANARMRQSPVQKAQKRKSGTLSQVISSRDDLLKEAQLGSRSQPNSAGLQIPAPFNTSSEDGSISPEPLSESIMGPPPRPASSLTPSPAIAAQRQKTKANAAGSAATPKSILSSTARQQPTNGSAQSDHSSDEPGALEELQLPEAATTRVSRRPSLAQIDTQMETVESPEQTPRFSARKTPKLGPLSTPLSTRLPSVLDSPSVASPMGASTPGNLLKDKRSDFKGSKGNKKRGSASASGSAMASPAIRPRISPSIKPLLPEGTALSSPAHALLLASKSNYQNLLEGNQLPGVSYPDSLSTGLTSKRTSHKVAEQGRRNRINDALKEMQALLPKQAKANKDINDDESPDVGAGADGDNKESKEDAAIKSNSSKAATVESANVYIRIMQQKDMERDAELERLRKYNEELVKKLAEHGAARDSMEQSAKAVDSASPSSVKVH